VKRSKREASNPVVAKTDFTVASTTKPYCLLVIYWPSPSLRLASVVIADPFITLHKAR
jgi:hypothetical protein